MNNYILRLETNTYNREIPLILKDTIDLFDDYFEQLNGEYIHNDYAFKLSVIDSQCNKVHIDSLFINNEIVDDEKFLCGCKTLHIFLECFGIVKIEVIIEGVSYITQNIRIIMKENAINNNILNMIDYIYDNCDDYLYEEHKHSKTATGINPNSKVSIDSKLSMINDIYDTYIKGYNILKYNAQTRLINTNKIGDFSELQSINSTTIDYIVNHPEELQPVSYNSGIAVNKQHYQPRKTLVQSVSYSSDIYENQVIVGFLKSVIKDLEDIKTLIESHKKQNSVPYKRDGYIDSSYYIYTRNVKLLNDYLLNIDDAIIRFQKLYLEFKKILNVNDINIISQPMYTNIFRRILPYNIIFEKICNWFNCGNYDLTKSDLLLSFVSISKIYEYFCLLKLNRAINNRGYTMEKGYSYKYDENKYYHNTTYNNTFEYAKDGIRITLYYQPIIYGKTNGRERPNGIMLFRNTTISIKDPSILAMLDDSAPQRGNSYVPDYLIKVNKENSTNYYILDAKHSTVNNIKRYQLPHLIFKYLFSISTYPQGENIKGMCILCGKDSFNSTENLYDIASSFNIKLNPQASICQITGTDISNDKDLEEYIKQIEL